MQYTKFILILSIFLCFSTICYGFPLDSKSNINQKINLTEPSAISANANKKRILTPSTEGYPISTKMITEKFGFGFKLIDKRGVPHDSLEQIKQDEDYAKQQVEHERE